MILGDDVSRLETFVWVLNHISRSITWRLFILKASYLVKWPTLTWSSLPDFKPWRTRYESLNYAARGLQVLLVLYQHLAWFISFYKITKSMRALWLVNQLWVIVPVNPRKNRASSELLYKSNRPKVSMGYLTNRPQVSMGYKLINHWDVGRTLEEFVNHSPATRSLQILLVFYQHPALFISL